MTRRSPCRAGPLAGLDAAPFARAEAGRLAEARLAALESRAEAALACGRPVAAWSPSWRR